MRVIRALLLVKKPMKCSLCSRNLLSVRNAILLTKGSKLFFMYCLLPYFWSTIDLAHSILYNMYTSSVLRRLMMYLSMFM